MGCGCGKTRSVLAPPTGEAATFQSQQSSPVMYDVFDGDGALVASYSNPVTARAEARRTTGNMVPRSSSVTGDPTASLTT